MTTALDRRSGPFAGEGIVTRLAIRTVLGDRRRNAIVVALIALGAATAVVAGGYFQGTGWTPVGLDPYGIGVGPVYSGLLVSLVPLGLMAAMATAAHVTAVRRNLRTYGLAMVNGATRVHVRGMVLRQSTLLGGLGGAVGVLLGVAVAEPILGMDIWPGYLDADAVSFGVPDVLGPFVVAVAASIAGGWVPAYLVGRVSAPAALAGRAPHPERTVRPIAPALGVGISGVALLTYLGASSATYASTDLRPFFVVAGGLIVLGVVLGAGGLVEGLGHVAHRLPLVPLLAVRDAARQRTRSSAVVVLLVLITGTATFAAATLTQQAIAEAPYRPDDRRTVVIAGHPASRPVDVDDLVASLPPVATRLRVDLLASSAGVLDLGGGGHAFGRRIFDTAVVDAELLAALGIDTTRVDPAAPATVYRLRGFHETLSGIDFPDRVRGRVTRLDPGAAEIDVPIEIVTVDAPAHPGWPLPNVLISPDLVRPLGLHGTGAAEVLRLERPATAIEARHAQTTGDDGLAVTVHGPEPDPTARVALVTGVIALLALAIAALATALAATESDRDLESMVALGGDPRLRRRFQGALAAYQVALGSAIGVAAATLGLWAHSRGGPEADWGYGPVERLRPGILPLSFWLLVAATPLIVGLLVAAGSRPARAPVSRRPT